MSLENKDASFNKARQYGYLLLKFRPRSSKEISQRLRRKGFDAKTIKEVTFYLEEKKFINDGDFSQAWIESRVRRGFGFKRIKLELEQKGIDKQIFDSQIREIKQRYPEKDILNRLAKERWPRLRNLPLQKAKQRLFGYLARRGFSPELIIESVNDLAKNNL